MSVLSRSAASAAGLIAWGGVAYLALRLGDLRLPEHDYCGPWGCGPPAEALLAVRALWLVLLVPPACVIGLRAAPATALRAGAAALAAAAALLAGVAAHEALVWWPQASELARQYPLRRYLFAVATETDVPACELGVAGLALCGIAVARGPRSRMKSPEPAEPGPAEPVGQDRERLPRPYL